MDDVNANRADRGTDGAGDALAATIRNSSGGSMAQCAFDGTIGRAVADYTGKEVVELEAVADPNAYAFAVRAVVRGYEPNPIFFLIRVPLQKVKVADLEEVEFTQWPPVAR